LKTSPLQVGCEYNGSRAKGATAPSHAGRASVQAEIERGVADVWRQEKCFTVKTCALPQEPRHHQDVRRAEPIPSAQSVSQPDPQPQRKAIRDYSRRSCFKKPASMMRGAARAFIVPRDMRTPAALRSLAR
jgi:hypothetical protein